MSIELLTKSDQARAIKILKEIRITGGRELIVGPLIELGELSDIKDKIKNERFFAPRLTVKLGEGISKGDFKLPIVHDNKTHPYYFELQQSYQNPGLFLAMVSEVKENKRYARWITNDSYYARACPNVFNHDIVKIDKYQSGFVYIKRNGSMFRDRRLREKIN